MKQIYEIRFHGRGGQGAKTASAVLASAALNSGKQIQSFPEYGAERQGAPVKAYTRISDEPIRIHYPITNPDMVVVIDKTLLKSIPVTDGLSEDGILIVNTPDSPDWVRKHTGFKGKIAALDATQISVELFGRNIPNTPTLGGILKLNPIVLIEQLFEEIKIQLGKKLSEDMITKNLKAAQRGYDEVRVE